MEKTEKLVFKFLVLLYFDIFAILLDFFIWSIVTALYFFIVDFFL